MCLCQLFLASRISRHIFLATTTKTNTSGNTLFYTDIMSNKHFLGVFSATYIFNHDKWREILEAKNNWHKHIPLVVSKNYGQK
jgi:hypothetical protein